MEADACPEKNKIKLTLVIKAVGNFCNLKCGYCFYQKECQQQKTIMDFELLEKIIKQFLETEQLVCKFLWHGGEPMLAGLEFYRRAIKLQQKYKMPNQKIVNSIQTNATLVNSEWVSFFTEHNFGVGISLDGCKSSHDKFRIYPDGSGSFDDVLKGVRKLQENGIKLGYIQTVVKENLPNVNEDFKFFTEELRTDNWGVNYYLDKADGRMYGQTVTPEEKAAHMIRNIELWLSRDDENLQIREIDNYFRQILRYDANHCGFNGSCGSFLCIDWKGDVYPCDRFSDSTGFFLGNLQNQNFFEILDGDPLAVHYENTAFLPEECEQCRWRSYCLNGCVHLRVPNARSKYYYCETRRKIFAYVEQLAEEFGMTNDNA